MKKLFAVCLLALLLCSFTIPFFASAEPTYPTSMPPETTIEPSEATIEATEPIKDSNGRPGRPNSNNSALKDPYEAKVERAQNNGKVVKPTAPPKQETVEPTKYNGPAVIPPQPDPEIDYLPMILIGSGVVVIGISVAVLIVSRKKSK